MKHYIKLISVLLVLLMTVTVIAACSNDGDNKNDPKDSERETETEREVETEQPITQEDVDQLKSDMSTSILEALENAQQTTEESETSDKGSGTDYAGVVEGLLGSLEGLGNGDYDYSKIIGEVLDQYIGSDGTSDFLTGLIMNWIQNSMTPSIPGITLPEQTTSEPAADETAPEEQTTEAPATEEPTTEQVTEPSVGGNVESLRDYVAHKTAEAITDAIIERINEVANGTLRDTIYDAVYESMSGNGGFMDDLIGESIPGFGGNWGGFIQ